MALTTSAARCEAPVDFIFWLAELLRVGIILDEDWIVDEVHTREMMSNGFLVLQASESQRLV